MYSDGYKLVNGNKPVKGHQTQENIAQLWKDCEKIHLDNAACIGHDFLP